MLSERQTRIGVLSLTLLQIVLMVSVLGWRANVWHDRGAVGLHYQGFRDEERMPEMLKRFPIFNSIRSQGVLMVNPDSPAGRAGIEPGDRIVSIGGVTPSEEERLKELDRTLRRGDRVVYEVTDEAGVTERLSLRLESPWRCGAFIVRVLTTIAVGLGFLLISALVGWTRPGVTASVVFYAMSTVGAQTFFAQALVDLEMGTYRGIYAAGEREWFTPQMGIFLWMALLALLMSALLLHLALVFPRRRPALDTYPGVLQWIYALPFASFVLGLAVGVAVGVSEDSPAVLAGVCAAALLLIAWPLISYARRPGEVRPLQWVAGHVWRCLSGVLGVQIALALALTFAPRVATIVGFVVGFFVIAVTPILVMAGYAIGTLVSLYRSYREAGVEEKRQIRWPLWGTMAAVFVTTVLALLTTMLVATSLEFVGRNQVLMSAIGGVTKAAYVLIPLSFAFGILKYRLMAIDVIIRRTVIYGAVTGIVLIGYLVAVAILGVGLISWVGVQNPAIVVIATLTIAALFIPLRNLVQNFFDRHFFRKRTDYTQALQVISADVLEAAELEPLLDRFAERVQQAMQVRSVAILVREPEGERFNLTSKVGIPDERLGRIDLPAGAALFLVEARVLTLQTAPLTEPDRAALRLAGAELFSVARVQGAPAGLLAVGKLLSGRPFEQDDLDFFAAAADHLSVALARLRRRREEVEFEQARVIQRSLLPDSVPQVEGLAISAFWKPAREVSGDYYDVLEFSEGKLGLCIGDVVGKGMPAALLMSSLQAAVRAIAPTEAPADKVCTQVRRVVARNLTGGKFVTFFYGIIDPARGVLTWSNLGHNPPLLVRSDGNVVRLAGEGGAIARIFVDTPIELKSVQLREGDRVLLFTDGASEARSPEGEEFGEERLLALLSARETSDPETILGRIAEAVDRFSGGVRFDDVTLVMIEVGATARPVLVRAGGGTRD